MKSIWIFILISIIANIIGTMSKANQKKKPISSAAKKTKSVDYSYRNQSMTPETSHKFNSSFDYDNGAKLQDTCCDDSGSYSYRVATEEPFQNESISEVEESYDLGLSEFQHAIIMSEILDKPLALRKR